MSGKIYLEFLFFCGIWSQSICGSFADENINESSISLVRQKRVISFVPGEDRIVSIRDRPYVVHIKQSNRIHCVGTILSQRVVITAAECVRHYAMQRFRVVSNSAASNGGISHNVTEIKMHSDHSPERTSDGIALLSINPHIVFDEYANKIDLHTGLILPGTIGTVSGWGYNFRNSADRGTAIPLQLRSIEVPIISHSECVTRYRHYFPITDKLICTFHSLKRTGHNDAGAPLVVDNMLVGLFLWRGLDIRVMSYADYPDVFAFLQHADYRRWISANI